MEDFENAEMKNIIIDDKTVSIDENTSYEESVLENDDGLVKESVDNENKNEEKQFQIIEDIQLEEVDQTEKENGVLEEIILGQEEDYKNAKDDGNYQKNADRVYNYDENQRKVGVYVKLNEQGYIVDINSDIFIEYFEGWKKIDEGEGDRFVHAQTCYFDESIIDGTGHYRYKG